ncbi:hypothetical protein AB0M61_05350 [Streptomyces sp. NPDC051642]|uniref:hypothetical protein n=1 Tax=Streptomyces sp. NPDC051642 TaxID=3154646 RepID=UPI0034261F81
MVVDVPASVSEVLIRSWLEPFLCCSDDGSPAAGKYADELSCRVVVDELPNQDLSYSQRHGLAVIDRIIHIRPTEDPYHAARSVLSLCRAFFKALAVATGGMNLHASCVVLDGKGTLVVGDRGAGKTTTLLRTLRGGEFSLLANDQVVAIAAPNGRTSLWGYPALIKVRESSAQVVQVPWEATMCFESDTLWPADDRRVGVFAPSDLCAALGSRVVAEAEPAFAVLYEQSSDPSEFVVSPAANDGSTWLSRAEFPLGTAYDSELTEIVDGLLDELPTRMTRALSIDIPSYRIRCGHDRLGDFVTALRNLAEKVRQ